MSVAAFSLDGSRVMTVAGEVIRVWDRSAGKPLVELRHAKSVTAASFSADGRFVVSASDDGTARIWDVASGHPRFVARHAESVRHALLLPDGRRLATYSAGRLRLWDVVDGTAEASEAVFELKDYQARPDNTIDGDAIAPDGNRIAARVGEAVQVWDVDQPRAAAPRFTLRHGGYVRKVAFIAGGSYLVTGADEKAAHVWDMKTGDERFALDHGAPIRHVAVSPDGRSVLTVGDDGTARLWDSETGKERHKLPHGCGLREGRFVDGSRLMATRSLDDGFKSECDSKVVLWDVATGQLRASMTVADEGDVKFSHDGRRMFSRHSLRGEIRPGAVEALSVWDADTGEARFAEAFVSPDHMRGAEFSRDGRLLLTAAGTQVSVWAIAGRELQAALAAAITVCLSSEFRRQNLGETDAEARRKQAACERKHGRG